MERWTGANFRICDDELKSFEKQDEVCIFHPEDHEGHEDGGCK
jgi:hypothetical protein